MLKGGIAFADKVTTVSRTYAREIQEPEYGEGLHELLRYREKDLSGSSMGSIIRYTARQRTNISSIIITAPRFGRRKRRIKSACRGRQDFRQIKICLRYASFPA